MRVPLPGMDVPREVATARRVAPMPGTQSLRLTFVLPLRNQADLDDLQRRLYDKTDPLCRHYLTSEEFTARFGPRLAEVNLVSRYAAAHGLALQDVTPNHTLIHVTGSVSVIEAAFGVRLDNYVGEDGHAFYAPDATPSFTSDIAGHLLGVLGLDTAQVPRHQPLHIVTPEEIRVRQSQGGANVYSSNGTGMTPNDIHSVYNIPSGAGYDGTGQTLALFELNTYTQSDVASYQILFNLPSTPVTPVSVDGFNTSAPTTYQDGSGEVTLDIDMMLALAPSASQILVYEGNNVVDIYNRIATDNIASVVSTSWYNTADDSTGGAVETGENQAFVQMAAQGQSMFAASGDGGAYPNQVVYGPNPTLTMQDPGGQPNLTSVGGTYLTDNSTEQYTSESSWADTADKRLHKNGSGQFDGYGTGGGGGIDPFWAIPDYQMGAFSASTNPQGSTTNRNVPDVSLYGDFSEGEYAVYFTGRDMNNNPLPGVYGLNGTSAAAPLWAAFTALINQQRALNSKPRVGFLNPSLYTILEDGAAYAADFHDINDGSNNLYYNAVDGYDNATGIGSFIGVNLIGDLSGTFVTLARNDNFANAFPITGNPGTVTGNNLGATREPSEPGSVANTGGHTIWWNWTAPGNDTTTVTTFGSNFDTTLGVYVGNAVNALTLIGANDDAGGTSQSSVTFNAVAGTKYSFAVDGYGMAEGNVMLNLVEAVSPPDNDPFANSIAVTAAPNNPATATGSNSGATSESGEPLDTQGSGGHTVWWKWTAPATGTATIDTYGSAFDTTLGIYTGSAVNALSLVASDDDAGGTPQSSVTFAVTAGVTYEISVDGYSTAEGNITLHVAETVPAPGNDNFANRYLITAAPGSGGRGTGTNYGATSESGEPLNTRDSGGDSIWWKWTAPVSSPVTIDTYGSNFDTTLGIYTGSAVNALSLVAWNDDAGGTPQSSVTFTAVAGVTYAILVDGYSTAEGGVTLHVTQAYPVPAIISFTPISGPVNTLVSIMGTGFTGATTVKFNGTAATFVTVNSDAQVSCYVAAGSTTGPITVTTPGGTAATRSNFTVTPPPPTITSFTPTSARVGTPVTIIGTHFTGATAVKFNGQIPFSFTVNSDTQISTIVPGGRASGTITVTTPGGTAVSAGSFTVIPPPTITSFTPSSGPPGTVITITGTQFTGVDQVDVNFFSASFTVNSDTQITATVPSDATTGSIFVDSGGLRVFSQTEFTVTASPPTITSFTPTSGLFGTVVTITGNGFTGATYVEFNGTNATYTVNSDTQITATVPSGAMTGPLSVTTPAGTTARTNTFTVTLPPTVSSFTPTSGPVGTVVTVTGTNLNGVTAVRFHNANATAFSANAAGTQLTVTVPSGAGTGTITVTTPGGSVKTATPFTVTTPPTITSFTPTAGPIGTVVTVTGTNLNGVTAVRFHNANATVFSANAAGTQLTVTVPTGAGTGTITVTTPGGSVKTATAFTVVVPPTITSFSPNSGPVGTIVTIIGTNLNGVTAVRFHNANATVFSANAGGTQLTVTVPSGAGTGTITVTTPGGQVKTATAFTVN